MSKPAISNVLASRYASADLTSIWSSSAKIVLERQLWIAVLKAQRDLGIDVPEQAITDYEQVVDQVDLQSIADRERVTRHDVKARIEEFNALAGHEQIHKGMTSRDLTENVEQLQILRSLEHVHAHGVAVLARITDRAAQYSTVVMAGRSHNVAAQATTLGKRFASAADELMIALTRLRELIDRYPLRGIKGRWAPARTCSTCSDGDAAKLADLEQRAASRVLAVADVGGAGVSAFARPRRGLCPGPDGRRTVVAGAHHPADGRARAGHRGFPARPGGQLGDAAQDEHPQLRAGQRPGGGPARLRFDGRGTGRRSGTRATCSVRWCVASRCPTRSSPSTA